MPNGDVALTRSMIPIVKALKFKHIIASGVPTVKKFKSVFIAAVLIAVALHATVAEAQKARWPEQRANACLLYTSRCV